MRRSMLAREVTGIGFALFFLLLGFAVAYLIWSMRIDLSDGAVIFLLLIPLLVYMIQTDRLRSLKGPAGLEANFLDTVASPAMSVMTESVDLITEQAYTFDPNDVLNPDEKTAEDEMAALRRKVADQSPILMALHLDYGHYDLEHLLEATQNLLIYPKFKFVIFLDHIEKNRFRAFMTAMAFYRVMTGSLAQHFLKIVNSGDLNTLLDFPGVHAVHITPKTDLLATLEAMTANRMDEILIIGRDGQVKGVVERDQLLSRLFLGMAQTAPKTGVSR